MTIDYNIMTTIMTILPAAIHYCANDYHDYYSGYLTRASGSSKMCAPLLTVTALPNRSDAILACRVDM